jgi:hypothetical protein
MTSTPARPYRTRRVARQGLVGAFLVVGLAGLGGALSPAVQAAATQPASAAAQLSAGLADPADDSSETQTHTWPDDEGTSRTGTVTVSQTKDLATRQIVNISWSGFLPTTNSFIPGQTVHSAPQTPLASGYPVVLLECQGDNADAMTPGDCAITGPSRFLDYAIYDANETDEVHHLTRVDSRSFTETSGKVDSAPAGQLVELPSDFNDSNVIGTNWYATWTDPDGTHANARFEVRSTKEAPESLGCSDPDSRMGGACSIVVVPIRPMPCIDGKKTLCTPPDDYQGNSANWKQWQSASNWRNRFVFPVTFRPFPDVCDLDSRIAVPTQGSQLLNQAMLSWLPKFCTSKDLFKLSFTRVNDSTARRNLDYQVAGDYASDLSFTSEPALSARGRPVVNAPVAVTGFTVAVTLDNKNFEQLDDVHLNARLLAKLVTESYAVPAGVADPNVEGNPQGLLQDPEFLKLNPTLADSLPPATFIYNPVVVQGSPDLVYQVTKYIASDPEAVAWLKGKPDPWGMKVNKTYQGDLWPVPSDQFEIRDPYTWKDDPTKCEPKPLMEQAAQFVYDLASVADAMVNRQPQSYNNCKLLSGDDTYGWAHPDRQLLGQRALLAIMDIPSSEAFQFPTAALENHAGKFVKPTLASLRAALNVATYDHRTGTLSANLKSTSAGAYPGMMPVYAAAPTHGLTKTLADQYATMITWMSTTGQTYGHQAGQIPEGYLALTPRLRAQAAAAAAHVRNQDCAGLVADDRSCSPRTPPPTTPPPVTTPPPPSTAPTTAYGNPGPTTQAPSGGVAPTRAVPTTPISSAPTTSTPSAEPVSYTSSQRSGLAMHLLPALLIIGLLGLLAAPVLVLLSRPGGGGSPLDRLSRRKKSPTTPKPPRKGGAP